MTSLSRHASLSNQFDSPESIAIKPSRSSSLASCSNLKPSIHFHELIESTSDLINEEESKFQYSILSNQSFHRIFIFDFDDTIFPTSIIQKNIKIWNFTELNTINEYKQCMTLYKTIKICIEYIINLRLKLIETYGKNNISFIIITNASIDWFNEIKLNHSKLIGSLINKLQLNISIISAKDEFELLYDDWYSKCGIISKQDSISNYIKSLNLNNKLPILYSIGDGKSEFEASINSMYELYENNLFILMRIQLKSNKKSNNKIFKSLNNFKKILLKTNKYLFQTNKELRNIIQTQTEYNSDQSDSECIANIIDYKL